MNDKGIVKFPGEFRRKPTIRASEKWESPDPSDLMVWEVCPYTRGVKMECQGCPEWQQDGERFQGEPFKLGCRGLAEEACRTMMAVQRREAIS